MALIKKHGFAEWYKCLAGYNYPPLQKGTDSEGRIVRKYIEGDKILDLGCGNNKTVPQAVGIDIIPNGKNIQSINGSSCADLVGNIENDLPVADESQDTIIARQILEHCLDTVHVLNLWKKKLR